MTAKLIFGCGYLGRRVANCWGADGEVVHALTRNEDRAAAWRGDGIRPIVGDVTDPGSLDPIRDLTNIDTVLYAVGFDRRAGLPIHQVYVEGLRTVLEVLPETVKRFIYISSTGVYGQTDGGWIDEDSSCVPTREGGKACLAAEQLLNASRFGNRAIVLRLAGIYGPDRVPRSAEVLNKESFPTDGHLNLIHVADAARAVLAAEEWAALPSLYLVSDGHPVLRADYYAELRRLLNISDTGGPEPSIADESLPVVETSSRKQRARADKRIRADRFREDLQMQLQFPTYREGLSAILGKEATSGG